MMSMFCNQCQEAAGGYGCTKRGVCGKNALTAHAQDVLIRATENLCHLACAARKKGLTLPSELASRVTQNLFVTITNANFDPEKINACIEQTQSLTQKIAKSTGLSFPEDGEGLENIPSDAVCSPVDGEDDAADRQSLSEIILYGLKGLSAYVQHARVLGYENTAIDLFIQETLSDRRRASSDTQALLSLVLKTGRYGVEAMALLDRAHTETFGTPKITQVSLEPGTRPGILISGHDLEDMKMLLEQTEGTGVDVYTHSEMLPAHYYPAFQKYPHLRGHYGNAWWRQRDEFASFQGPILMTTNCIVPPAPEYQDRLFTTGEAGFPGCTHIEADANGHKDFSPLIDMARHCPPPTPLEQGHLIGGFAHDQVLALVEPIAQAIESGAIRHFVVMAGCDGRHAERDYYTDFAQALPKDTVILTAGCAKYRYNKLDLGSIGDIPRVLDAGQCNDSYSLALIALKLKERFGLYDINDLPIVYNIAWYEQKAVIVLLALLSLGVKKIHLGPSLPAFLSPRVRDILIEKFDLGTIRTVSQDLADWID